MICVRCTGHVEFDDAAILPEGWAHRECVDPPIAAAVPPEGAIPVKVTNTPYGRSQDSTVCRTDVRKVRIPPGSYYLVKRHADD